MNDIQMDIYVTKVTDRKVACITAIREALILLGGDASLSVSRQIYNTVYDTGKPEYLGMVMKQNVADTVLTALRDAGVEAALVPQGSSPVEGNEPEKNEPDADFMPSYASDQAAMVLLAMCEGKPGYALQTAQLLALHLGDEDTPNEFWQSVSMTLVETFPPPQQITLAQLMEGQSG